MITQVQIENYRSIVRATVPLSPFTLLIGANGTGKSNFVRLFENVSSRQPTIQMIDEHHFSFQNVPQKHINHLSEPQNIIFTTDRDYKTSGDFYKDYSAKVFSINPDKVAAEEAIAAMPMVKGDGSGSVQVLDFLKTGDREDLFEKIEESLKKYIPEIKKLSFVPADNGKYLQVRERFIEQPIPLRELSEGTRLILTILTIIHQISPPKILCFEEIDRGLHPSLFQKIIQLFFDITREKDIQIIATTHSPYLLDEFKDHEDAVIVVEKENGETKFTTLAEKMKFLEGVDLGDDQLPLGELWYGGFVGGVPVRG